MFNAVCSGVYLTDLTFIDENPNEVRIIRPFDRKVTNGSNINTKSISMTRSVDMNQTPFSRDTVRTLTAETHSGEWPH